MTGYFLERIEIEGFRGINNEGAPLILKLKHDKVNSVSADNGVGKSSIFDAVTYAITGRIRRLDDLPAAEGAAGYYLNRFHKGGFGTVKLALCPDDGSDPFEILVTRDATGARSTSCSATGIDPNQVLASLDREFVLLDAPTFHDFIDRQPLDRGRNFAGLLGLSRFSSLRQGLQSLCNTRAFNNHFGIAARAAEKAAAQRRVDLLSKSIAGHYATLVGEQLDSAVSKPEAHDRAHQALAKIAVLAPHCVDKHFLEIDIDDCTTAVRTAESGPERQRLQSLIHDLETWTTAADGLPISSVSDQLISLAEARDAALGTTRGDLMRELFQVSDRVFTSGACPEDHCPTCDREADFSVHGAVKAQLANYVAVEAAVAALKSAWTEHGLDDVVAPERRVSTDGEELLFQDAALKVAAGTFTTTDATALATRLEVVRQRVVAARSKSETEKLSLEATLPPSLVAVTEAVEAARSLQREWNQLDEAEADYASEVQWSEQTAVLKKFLDDACELFAGAEARAAARRLAAVEPLCQEFFAAVMHQPVVPALVKPRGREDLAISLSSFFSVPDVSAQAVLSESYRNAFAASVYLAAAKLYGGSPRFVILDDVTSSFDGGHQFHLLELIRTRFARPGVADGPQVILLSHDTLLEKLFNKNVANGDWWHQRLQGTPRTAVLPKSNAMTKVGDKTRQHLAAGRVDDAAPFLRQYLEYRLEEVVNQCRIPVPLDMALSDSKQMAQGFIDAITSAVKLHKEAGSLVLTPTQQTGLSTNVVTITGNYLAHWATGSTLGFTSGSLLGVMDAIDAYVDCFKYVDPSSGQKRFYRSLGQQ